MRRSRMQFHRSRPGTIVTSGIYAQLSLLTREEGQVRGKTYPQAQGDFALEVDPQPDRRVGLSLVPELQYGQPRQQWIGEDGVFRLQSRRPKKLFDELKIAAKLAPIKCS